MQEFNLKKYIYDCSEPYRGTFETRDFIELLLALHMLREVSLIDGREQYKYDLHQFSVGDIFKRFSEVLHLLELKDCDEFSALKSKLKYLASDFRQLFHIVKVSSAFDWQQVCVETQRTLNQTVINMLLEELLENKVHKHKYADLGILSDFGCEIVACILEHYDVTEVYDPCAGSSKLAVFAGRTPRHYINSQQKRKLIVSDINQTAIFLSFGRFLAESITRYEIRKADSITDNLLSEQHFSCAVFAPPIRMDASKYQGIFEGSSFFNKSDATPIFINMTLEALHADGVAIAILPDSFLIGQGKIANYRSSLIEKGLIKCVIKLPKNSLSNTSIQMSIVLLDKQARSEHVRLIDTTVSFEKSTYRASDIHFSPDEIASLALGQNIRSDRNSCVDLSLAELLNNGGVLHFDYYRQFLLDNEASAFVASLNNSEVKKFTLGDICDVEFGRHISKEFISDKMSSDGIPFLKIGDIKSIDTVHPKSWIELNDFSRLIPKLAVHGSIVFSIQGTLGKLAIVKKEEEFFPSPGIAVLDIKAPSISPAYLAAYLSSELVKRWLETVSSTSSIIRRIDKKQLKKLPIVLPSFDWQEMAAKEFIENRTDALDSLKLLTSDIESREFINPLRKIDKFTSTFLMGLKSTDYPSFFSSVSNFRHDLQMNDSINYTGHQREQLEIIKELREILSVLDNLHFVHDGHSEVSILEIVENKLLALTSRLRDNLYFSSLVFNICGGLRTSIQQCIDNSVSNGELLIELSSTEAWGNGELEIVLNNTFKFPLIDIKIKSEGLKETKSIPYISDGLRVVTKLFVDYQELSAFKILVLEWSARSYDNSSYEGKLELGGLNALSSRSVIEWEASPYITGDPVKPNQQMSLYGRDEILSSISRYISDSGNVVLLEGNRRVGKSSILYHLQSNDYIPGWICVYMSLQECEGCDKSGIPAWSIWQVMASQIVTTLVKSGRSVHLPNGDVIAPDGSRFFQRQVKKSIKELISVDTPFFDFQSYLEEILEDLKQSKTGIVIMIDEFDKLQEGIDNGVTTPQVPENIRSIIHRYDNLSAILTGSRRLQRLREEYWSALFGLGTRIGVSELDTLNARKLVTEPSLGQLNFTDDALDFIVDQTGRHPFLIQCLCNKLYDNAAKQNIRQIDSKFVFNAISEFIKDNEHFMYFWNLAEVTPGDSRCQLILFIFAREERDGNTLTSGELKETLIECGIDLTEKQFDLFINYLMELELIRRKGERGEQIYSLTTPLLSVWLLESQDYERVLASARQQFEKD
jgi:type I restriction enzyme M protein